MNCYKLKATFWEKSPKGNSITSKADFLIDATDRTEATNRITAFLKDAGATSVLLIEGGQVDVLKVCASDYDSLNSWFQARVLFRNDDDIAHTEKRSRHTVYVQGLDIMEVCDRLGRELPSLTEFFFIESVKVTSITEFFPSIEETEAQMIELESL